MKNNEHSKKRRRKKLKRNLIVYTQRFLVAALAAVTLGSIAWGLTACSKLELPEKVVLTTGLEKDEVFRINDISCRLPEIMLYLANTMDQYDQTFGSEIWEIKSGTVTLEQNIKDTVLARISQIKVMNLLARKYEVTLSADEQKLVNKVAGEYFESLSDGEKRELKVTKELLGQMYTEYALADKVYEYIIKDINPEISDDEARTISVQRILIKTYATDENGNRIPFSEGEKEDAKRTVETVRKAAVAGTDFEELIGKYSEESVSSYSFGKGEVEEAFEDAAFNLGKDEISDVVETGDGFIIIKCISTFDKEQTEANKIKIVEQKRKEAFSKEYDAFVASLTRLLNTDLWEDVVFTRNGEIKTTDFFKTYTKYFGERNGSL